MTFEMIAPDEMEQYIQDKKSLIIDIREREEYNIRHIKGAVNIPYREWRAYWRNGEMNRITAGKKLILYCERGPTSFAAAKEMAEKGIKVGVMVGGIHAYRGKMTERY